jgi:hypothetical protein
VTQDTRVWDGENYSRYRAEVIWKMRAERERAKRRERLK